MRLSRKPRGGSACLLSFIVGALLCEFKRPRRPACVFQLAGAGLSGVLSLSECVLEARILF